MRGLLAASLAAIAVALLAPSAFASGTTSTLTTPVFDDQGHLVKRYQDTAAKNRQTTITHQYPIRV